MTIKRSTGLVDKLNGLKTNLVLNGSFESNAHDNWTASGATTLTSPAGGSTGNALTVASPTGAVGTGFQDITTVVGRVYRISWYFLKGTGATGSVAVGTTAAPTSILNVTGLTNASWTLYERAFIATATTTRITLQSDSTTLNETARFDEVVVEEVFDGLVEIMRNCKLNVYSGAQATNADTGASAGNVLVTVTLNSSPSTGLTFSMSSNGVVSKPSGDTWSGAIGQNGTATWFRFFEFGDDPSLFSTTAARMDGTVGTSGTDMIVGSTTLTALLTWTVNGFSYTATK